MLVPWWSQYVPSLPRSLAREEDNLQQQHCRQYYYCLESRSRSSRLEVPWQRYPGGAAVRRRRTTGSPKPTGKMTPAPQRRLFPVLRLQSCWPCTRATPEGAAHPGTGRPSTPVSRSQICRRCRSDSIPSTKLPALPGAGLYVCLVTTTPDSLLPRSCVSGWKALFERTKRRPTSQAIKE